MVRSTLIEETAEGAVARDTEVLDRPARLSSLSSGLAWRILQELARTPDYPGSLAVRLKVHEQKIYYHVRRLLAAGFLRVVREEARQGASAKILAPTAEAFAVVLKGRGTPTPAPAFPRSGVLARFFEGFSRRGTFDGSIVIGSPYPHGPFLTTARDSPYAVELGFFLGRLFSAPKGFVVRLDTEVKAAGTAREAMILVGGPVANIITADLNSHLAVNFEWRQVWRVESSKTKRSYADEQAGLIARVRNPWTGGAPILLLSGLHHAGTHASILALTRFADEVLEGYEDGQDFYRVVAGQDRDGDGRIDAIAILE
ncbi:MAG TPA: S-layer protein [Thermoplasmata archaeon]